MTTATAEPPEVFDSRDLTIPADLSHLARARAFAEAAAADFGFPAEVRYQVKLALSEAVGNAIKHGSTASDDSISLMAAAEGRALVFRVVDTGRFVPPPDPTDDLPESGRGLEFMAQLMDEVEVMPSSGGTVMRLAKRR